MGSTGLKAFFLPLAEGMLTIVRMMYIWEKATRTMQQRMTVDESIKSICSMVVVSAQAGASKVHCHKEVVNDVGVTEGQLGNEDAWKEHRYEASHPREHDCPDADRGPHAGAVPQWAADGGTAVTGLTVSRRNSGVPRKKQTSHWVIQPAEEMVSSPDSELASALGKGQRGRGYPRWRGCTGRSTWRCGGG